MYMKNEDDKTKEIRESSKTKTKTMKQNKSESKVILNANVFFCLHEYTCILLYIYLSIYVLRGISTFILAIFLKLTNLYFFFNKMNARNHKNINEMHFCDEKEMFYQIYIKILIIGLFVGVICTYT